MRATPWLTLRSTNSSPRLGLPWLNSIPDARVKAVALAVVDRDPVPVDLRDPVRAPRIERASSRSGEPRWTFPNISEDEAW